MDFNRSLAKQEVMCELTACFTLATYFLDAFSVTGYLWSGGMKGSGKTNYIALIADMAYLGQLILASTTQACLRDMADYGAFLAFDDAEAVMDIRRTDPDKRAIMLAGNRRGVIVAVKEPEPDGKGWKTRYVDVFCPKAFSAIKLPDDVLGSRTIVTPLVRSTDALKANADATKYADWPCNRRELLDDLWALGLTHLPELAEHDKQAAAVATLEGRSLDTWRPILAVAHWLQNKHGVLGLFDRLEALSVRYDQDECNEYGNDIYTRTFFRVLLTLREDKKDGQVHIWPGEVANKMNEIAFGEDLVEDTLPDGTPNKFTSPSKVGYMCRQQRFRRPTGRNNQGKEWLATREELVKSARSFGVTDGREAGDDPPEGQSTAVAGPLFGPGGEPNG
jgi:hypothetical protein